MAVQHLPSREQDLLRTLRDDLPALRARVRDLRAQGWTLAAIGTPLEARRSTVRSWEQHPDSSRDPDLPDLPTPPNLRPAPHPTSPSSTHVSTHPSVRSLRPDVPLPDQDRIRQLAPLARKVRGGTPLLSPSRAAKRELDALLLTYYTRGVPVARLASISGVSYRAMKVRLDAALSASRAAHPSTRTHPTATATATGTL